MKTRLSVLLLISLFLSGCGANAAPTATLVESTPTALAPQEPASTVSIVTPTLDIATIIVTEPSATAESTMTPQATPTSQPTATSGMILEIVSDATQVILPQPQVCQPAHQNWIAYTVSRNDTLSSLGQRTGTSWQQIQAANCLTSTTIFAGQTLYLPSVPASVVDITPATSFTTPIPPPIRPKDPSVTVTPQVGPPETNFKFVIEHFPPNEEITVIIQKVGSEDAVTLGITADGNGNATMSYISPQNAPTGIYNVTAINIATQKHASGGFAIRGP